jgi:AcrR family transcriptional regulator
MNLVDQVNIVHYIEGVHFRITRLPMESLSAQRREREKQETRDKILDAARELFLKHGYDAVSMRKIADAIAYTPAALYVHFKDKEALMREMCRRDYGEFSKAMASLASEPDPIKRIRGAGLAYITFGVRHPNHYRLMFMTKTANLELDEDDLRRKGNPDEDGYAFVRQAVQQAIAEGRFRPEFTDPDLVAQLLWAGVHGVASLEITKGDDKWCPWRGHEQLAVAMGDILLRGLCAADAE